MDRAGDDATLQIRAVRYDHPDAAALTEQTQQYYVQIYGGRDADPLTAAQLAPPTGGFFVGYAGPLAVAMGGWLFTKETSQHGDAQIRRMFVHPAARHRGFGRLLLTVLEVDAAACGARRMVLTTGDRQIAAVGLYRASGYVDIEPFGFYGGSPTASCLGKRL